MPEATAGRERVVDRLKKMLRHAESAKEIGSEEEAQAFAAKIQELLSLHKIELSEVEYRKLDEVDPVVHKLVDFGSAGIPIRKRRIEWQEELALIVCQAYFCKVIVIGGTSNLYFAGRGLDLEAAEKTFLYLARVARSIAEKQYMKFFHECRKAGNVEAARGFIRSYLVGFTTRLAERYEEERQRIKAEHAASGTALVRLTDALTAVGDYVQRTMKTKKAPFLMGSGIENEHGYKRGRQDAEAIPIGQNPKQVEAK